MCVYNIRARIVFSSLVFFGCVWRVFYQHLSSVGMSVLPNTKKREKRALYSTGFPSPTRLAVLFSYIFWNKIKQERKTSFLFDDDWDQQVQLYIKELMHQRVPFKPVVKKWNGSTLFNWVFLLCEIFINSESLMLFTGIKYWKFVNPFFFFPCLNVFLSWWLTRVFVFHSIRTQLSSCDVDRKVDGISS